MSRLSVELAIAAAGLLVLGTVALAPAVLAWVFGPTRGTIDMEELL